MRGELEDSRRSIETLAAVARNIKSQIDLRLIKYLEIIIEKVITSLTI